MASTTEPSNRNFRLMKMNCGKYEGYPALFPLATNTSSIRLIADDLNDEDQPFHLTFPLTRQPLSLFNDMLSRHKNT